MGTDVLVVIIGFTIAYLIEARHDHILAAKEQLIRLLASKEEIKIQAKLSDDWHRLDWWYLLVIGIIVSLLFDGTWIEKVCILVIISTLKILVFNTYLNKLLGNKIFYLGGGFVESKFKGKEMFYYGTALLFFIISILILWLLN